MPPELEVKVKFFQKGRLFPKILEKIVKIVVGNWKILIHWKPDPSH